METTRQYRFRLPREHGAWWTFFSCLIAGGLQALAWKADRAVLACLALGMACFFLASHWVMDLAVAALHQGKSPSQAKNSARGWSLLAAGKLLIGFALVRAEAGRFGMGLQLGLGLALSALAIMAVLLLRLKLHERSLSLLMPSAMLLTLPAWLLGGLAFGSLGLKALLFWSAWACFFAAGVLYIQTWLRGAMLPLWRIYAGSLPYLAEALILALFFSWPGVLLMSLFAFRLLWRLRDRVEAWREARAELEGGPTPQRLPTDGREIRKLGWEQVAWSLVFAVFLTLHFLPQP